MRNFYNESISDPEAFWAAQAEQELDWFKKWDAVLRHDFSGIGTKQEPYVEWFRGGQINVSYNCLDRHLSTRGDKPSVDLARRARR